jgi:hypothetical protein
MDGPQLDFSPLPLACLTQDWHSQEKSAMLKGEKCRNETKTTEEAAHSWLTRVAQVYGLNADRLIGQLLPEHNSTFCLERAFYAPYVDALSKATRIPRRVLSELQGAPVDWILQDRRYCNVCIRCIETDALTEHAHSCGSNGAKLGKRIAQFMAFDYFVPL